MTSRGARDVEVEVEGRRIVLRNLDKVLYPAAGFQNDPHKTTVCAYSLRARPRPTVSTPLRWSEVERAARARDATGLLVEARDVLARVDRHGDLFAPVLSLRQRLPDARRLERAPAR